MLENMLIDSASEFLKYLRIKTGDTQKDMANKIGCPKKDIADFESGVTQPRVLFFSKLMKAYDLNEAQKENLMEIIAHTIGEVEIRTRGERDISLALWRLKHIVENADLNTLEEVKGQLTVFTEKLEKAANTPQMEIPYVPF